MNGLVAALLLCLAAHSFDVELWGDKGDRDTYVTLLEQHGITINEEDKVNSLLSYKEWRKDGVIICTDEVTDELLIPFLNSGHSAVIFLNDQASSIHDVIRELAIEPSSSYVDTTKCWYFSPTQDKTEHSVECGGFSFTTENASHAVFYYPFVDGYNNAYAVATQGKNDARVVIFGGEMFGTDEEQQHDPKAFNAVVDLTLWAFRKNGVMRARDLKYVRLADGDVNPPELTISDEIDFSIVLETYNEEKSEWVPYDADDVQLDFTMLVPRIRKTLKSYKNGTFGLRFQIPDIFGVYQFILDYHARGFTPLNVTHQLMVHPLRHDEQPRFVKGAYPFYVAALIMCVAVVCLCIAIARSAPLFLQAPPESKSKKEKKEEKPSAKSSQKAKSE